MAAFRNAVTSGISPAEFWGLTPYLTRHAMAAMSDSRTITAWMTANLSRAKTLPKLEKLLSKTEVKTGDIGMRLRSALDQVKGK